jgi:hypothetical protein
MGVEAASFYSSSYLLYGKMASSDPDGWQCMFFKTVGT